MSRTKVSCVCENPECRKMFERLLSEVTRSNKLKRHCYCSIECSNKYAYTKDEYTGLREYLKRAKRRGKDCDITLDDLLNKWNEQGGICPYTGVKLIHPKPRTRIQHLYLSSLDRINPSIGYIKGNIQFISTCANFAKSIMSNDEMVEFCKIVAKHWSNSDTQHLR